jgi:hypothetical protein
MVMSVHVLLLAVLLAIANVEFALARMGSSPQLAAPQRHIDHVHTLRRRLNTVPELSNRTALSAREHICAIRSSGALFCWGSNAFGQLNIIAEVSKEPSFNWPYPVDVSNGKKWRRIAAGLSHTCMFLRISLFSVLCRVMTRSSKSPSFLFGTFRRYHDRTRGPVLGCQRIWISRRRHIGKRKRSLYGCRQKAMVRY